MPKDYYTVLEAIKMQLKLEASKYETSVKSFIYVSNTYISFYYGADIFLRTL